MYLKRGKKCKQLYDICRDVWDHANDYGFLPLDDQLLAVAISVIDCPCVNGGRLYDVVVYPFHKEMKWNPKPDMFHKNLSYDRPDYGHVEGALLCHWGNALTTKPLYKREIEALDAYMDENGMSVLKFLRIETSFFLRSLMEIVLWLPKKIMVFIQSFVCNHPKLRKALKPIEIIVKKIERK